MTKRKGGTKEHVHTPMPLGVVGELTLLVERYQNFPGIHQDLRTYLELHQKLSKEQEVLRRD